MHADSAAGGDENVAVMQPISEVRQTVIGREEGA